MTEVVEPPTNQRAGYEAARVVLAEQARRLGLAGWPIGQLVADVLGAASPYIIRDLAAAHALELQDVRIRAAAELAAAVRFGQDQGAAALSFAQRIREQQELIVALEAREAGYVTRVGMLRDYLERIVSAQYVGAEPAGRKLAREALKV